jgi:hypothetical protein
MLQSGEIFAQHHYHNKDHHGSCGNTSCFQSEIVKAEKTGEHCTAYQIKVSFEGRCDNALSHYMVGIPCGKVEGLSNSENWKQEFGYDKTTKLDGFKIDDIRNFGEGRLKSFLINFTLCSYSDKCDDKLDCWQPVVAYKAGRNVYYDTLTNSCPASLAAAIQKHDVSCYGAADGAVSVTVSEGEAPYTYTWSNGSNQPSLTGVAAGTYSVTVQDATGAQVSLQATIAQPTQIAISNTVTNASCSGKADGAIDVSVTGGSGGYTYVWNTGATTQDLASLKAGAYTLTVKDSTGCTAQKAITVTDNTQITIAATLTQPGCNQTNGAINITVTGGTAPYTYVWSNGQTTEDVQALAPGTYKVTVADANGCTAELSAVVRENNTLKLTAVVKQTSCLDDASGAIDLVITGGTGPYTYVWSNGAITEDLSSLTAGIYKVTVTDANGCTATLQVSVSKKTFIIGNLVTQPKCYGDATGSITLTPSGGTSPYTFIWSTGATGNTVTNLPGGTYTVTVTDATGCSRLVTFIITDPPAISAVTSINNAQCSAEGHYSVDLAVSGGTAPYTYTWSNGATTQDLDSLSSGTYTVQITDANGCATSTIVTIPTGSSSWACLINAPAATPNCSSTGNTLSTSVTGGTYQWSVQSSDGQWTITANASTGSITYTAGGTNSSATFTLTMTKNGCTQTCTYTVATCTSDSTGGEDPGGEDPGNTESCETCFDSSIKTVSSSGSCITYQATVSTDGACLHDLSHWVIAIPCGSVSNYTNSLGFKMEFGTDPTTGLYGLKVDDVNNFGDKAASFTVSFTVCAERSSCLDKLRNWSPVVAYKAGRCIAYDTLNVNGGSDNPDDNPVCAYPNPFHGQIKFRWKCHEDDHVQIHLVDKCGKRVCKVFDGDVRKGNDYDAEVPADGLSDDFYIYCFTSTKKRPVYGKLVRRR